MDYEQRRRQMLAAAEARQRDNEQRGLNPRAAAKLKESGSSSSQAPMLMEARRNDEIVAGWRS